jgi:hypothetical protein
VPQPKSREVVEENVTPSANLAQEFSDQARQKLIPVMELRVEIKCHGAAGFPRRHANFATFFQYFAGRDST